MNIFKSVIISAFFLCFSSFGMEPVDSQSQTIVDLRKIAQHWDVGSHEYTTVEEEIIDTCKRIKAKAPVSSESLELGLDLLQTAALLETIAKEQGYTLWWRYSNGIEDDIATGKNKSFGRTLLAGFIDDGVKHFKGGMFGFNTACSYIYWANTRYFGYYLFEEQLKYLRDFQEFVSKNEYSVDMKVLIDAQEFCEKQKLALSSYDKVIEFFSKEENQKIENDFNNKINNLIIKIQYDSKYNKESQEEKITELHGRKSILFLMNFTEIEKALLGTLFILPLKDSEEEFLLEESYNRGVTPLEKSVFGRGEDFHPRLSSQLLEQMKGRLIPIYSNGQLVDALQIKAQLAKQIS